MKILVVHRQKLIVDQIKSVLNDDKTVVVYYDSGLDGLLTSRIESFDLIICGIDLPVVTGFEIARSVRTISINTRVPIILVSNNVIDSKTEKLGATLGLGGLVNFDNLSDELPGMIARSIQKEGMRQPEHLPLN